MVVDEHADAQRPPEAAEGSRPRAPGRLIDFTALVRGLFWAAVVLGGLAVAGAVVQGLVQGLTFAILLQWATLWLLGLVVAAAALVAAHALRGAGRARRRGERLSSDDVGALPVLPEHPRGRRERDD